jgi:hypothetical protein
MGSKSRPVARSRRAQSLAYRLVIHNITHYSPGTRSSRRGVVAPTPRAARETRGSAHLS